MKPKLQREITVSITQEQLVEAYGLDPEDPWKVFGVFHDSTYSFPNIRVEKDEPDGTKLVVHLSRSTLRKVLKGLARAPRRWAYLPWTVFTTFVFFKELDEPGVVAKVSWLEDYTE